MPVQEQTPLEQATWLTEVTGNNFLLKREDLQPVRLREITRFVTRHYVMLRHPLDMMNNLCSIDLRCTQVGKLKV